MPPGRDQLKAMARMARIIAALDNAGKVGVTATRLLAIADYGGQQAPQDQLSRDLKHLRDQGWQIDNLSPKNEEGRYRMVSGDNRLRVKLSETQLAALHRAVILTNRSDLAKRLGVPPGKLPAGVGSEVLPAKASTALSLALRAVELRSRMLFTYKGSPRVVHPGAVRFQNYRWYLTGVEEGFEVAKSFIVAEMRDLSLDRPGTAADVPAARRLTLHPLRWHVDPPTPVTVRTTTEFVPDVVRWLLEPRAQTEEGDVVDMAYTVTNRQSFRDRIYVLGERVTIPGGGEIHADVVAGLRGILH